MPLVSRLAGRHRALDAHYLMVAWLFKAARRFRKGPPRERSAHDALYREPEIDSGCPLGAHRRLLDAHALWHQAATSYEDADRFRANLNAAIQALRSVTLVLQTEQDRIADFDTWYAPWQTTLKADPTCSWLNDARVQVFHLRDLEVNSRARVSVVLDPQGTRRAAELDLPAGAPLDLVTTEARRVLAEYKLERGFAIVERRWVANDLPNLELLDALAHCYALLDRVVADAHGHLKTGARSVFAEKLACMTHGLDARAQRIDVVTGQRMDYKAVEVTVTPEIAAVVSKRYGPTPPRAAGSPRELAEQIVEFSKRILKRDGNHQPMLWLWRRDGRIVIEGLIFGDATDKLAQWDRVAKEVERLDAIALIFAAEVWVRDKAGGRAKGEALSVLLATEDGDLVAWATRFSRRFGRIRLEPTTMVTEQQPFFLAPVLKVWRERKSDAPR